MLTCHSFCSSSRSLISVDWISNSSSSIQIDCFALLSLFGVKVLARVKDSASMSTSCQTKIKNCNVNWIFLELRNLSWGHFCLILLKRPEKSCLWGNGYENSVETLFWLGMVSRFLRVHFSETFLQGHWGIFCWLLYRIFIATLCFCNLGRKDYGREEMSK